MRYLPSAKVWLIVFVYGTLAQGCGHIAGAIAEARGKDPEPAFYMVLLISVLILALIANTLAIVRKVLEMIIALIY